MNYYNEFDPDAAAWLGELVASGNIPAGRVDDRSVALVAPGDLSGYTQCHFFAGIGGWAYALKLAGWGDDRPVWTASLPCQPFSVSGKRLGEADERHLWPVFRELVRECQPPIIFGEQVSSSAVIGKVCDIEEMQEVLDREAVLGVLRQLQGAPANDMQGMRVCDGEGSEIKNHQEKVGAIQWVEKDEARVCSDGGCEVQGEETQPSIRFGSRGNPDAGGCWEVRVDGHSVQPERAESVECAIIGPDCSGEGIREGQRQGGAVLVERDGEHLGSEQDFGDCVGDFSPEEGPVERFVQSDWSEASAEAEKVWFDGIRADLERDGYAVWACSACAPSVGAPHIRQRLYWVAVRLADAERADGRRQHRDGVDRAPGAGEEASGQRQRIWLDAWNGGADDRMAYGVQPGLEGHAGDEYHRNEPGRVGEDATGSATEGGSLDAWSDSYLVECRDWKVRRVGTGLFPLAHGLPSGVVPSGDPDQQEANASQEARKVRLKGYGNAIVPQLAAEFIRTVMDFLDQENTN